MFLELHLNDSDKTPVTINVKRIDKMIPTPDGGTAITLSYGEMITVTEGYLTITAKKQIQTN